ncbi:MAG TPA: hypothetical protein VH391_04495 [Solirubrobacterales bacterium]|jgi:hypothetical protein
MATSPHNTEIRLLSGDVFSVEGSLEQVEKVLSDAARSGQGRLAWFKQQGGGDAVGLNPTHVAAVRVSDSD